MVSQRAFVKQFGSEEASPTWESPIKRLAENRGFAPKNGPGNTSGLNSWVVLPSAEHAGAVQAGSQGAKCPWCCWGRCKRVWGAAPAQWGRGLDASPWPKSFLFFFGAGLRWLVQRFGLGFGALPWEDGGEGEPQRVKIPIFSPNLMPLCAMGLNRREGKGSGMEEDPQ